jgi:uncharacterized protein with GYD domain
MPTYITLMRWTSQGSKTVKDSPSRLDAARKAFQAAGLILKDFYMVTGRYDMVVISEAPDDIALAKATLSSRRTATCKPKHSARSARRNIEASSAVSNPFVNP